MARLATVAFVFLAAGHALGAAAPNPCAEAAGLRKQLDDLQEQFELLKAEAEPYCKAKAKEECRKRLAELNAIVKQMKALNAQRHIAEQACKRQRARG